MKDLSKNMICEDVGRILASLNYILYRDVYAMLKTRDKIINEYLDKENLEKARGRLAVASGLHPRLGTNTPIADDLIEKITTNLTGRGKHGKKLSSKKRNKKSKKRKLKNLNKVFSILYQTFILILL